MKKFVAILTVLLLMAVLPLTVLADDSGSGSSTITTHISSHYSIVIPATIDLTQGNTSQVSIENASIEDGYSVKVFLTELDDPNGIRLFNASGSNYIVCSITNAETNSIADATNPLATFTKENIANSVTTKNFYLDTDSTSVAGTYTGTMHYRFECSPQ